MKRYQEIFCALKEKAENAYLNGEISSARHIAAAALEKWPDGASLLDVSWCFAILLHCYKSETDHVYLDSRYFCQEGADTHKRLRFKTEGTNCQHFISFMLEVLQPAISPKMMEHWQDTFLTIKDLKLPDEVSTALLLTTVMETWCFLDSETWSDIGDHFCKISAQTHPYVFQELRRCRRRLSLQMHLIAGKAPSKNELEGWSPEEQLLILAWNAYFQSDFHGLDRLLSQLSSLTNCESEYFLSIQGLFNATRFSRMIARRKKRETLMEDGIDDQLIESNSPRSIALYGNEGDEDIPDPEPDPFEYANYLRYQRFEAEQPLASFLALREAGARMSAHRVREKSLSGERAASEAWTLFRTVPFLWASALRYWNIADLVQVNKLMMEFKWASAVYYENGAYCGDADDAAAAIISGIMSMDSAPYKRKDVHVLIGILDRYGTSSAIEQLYHFIFEEAPPITWKLCVEWLELLGDLLPGSLIGECVNWTLRYYDRSKELLTAYNAEEYAYLLPIFQYYALSQREQAALDPFCERILYPIEKERNFKIILKYLADHNWAECQRYMERSLDWAENPRNQALIIDPIMDLAKYKPEVSDYCAELLEKRAEKANSTEYIKFANVLRSPDRKSAPDLPQIAQLLQNAIDVMNEKSYRSTELTPVFRELECRDWSLPKADEFSSILELVSPILRGAHRVYPLYTICLLDILQIMFRDAESGAQEMLADVLTASLSQFETLFTRHRQRARSLDTFRFEFYRSENVHSQLLLVFCQIYDGMSASQKLKVLAYAVKGLVWFPNAVYYPTYLFLRASLDDPELRGWAQSGLFQIETIALDPDQQDRLQHILQGIISAQEKADIINAEHLTDFIMLMAQTGSESIYCSSRILASQLLRMLEEGTFINTDIQALLDRLKKDHRKSVRNIFDSSCALDP